MGQRIWGVLAQYEGSWVALDKQGRVVAHAPTLPDLILRSDGLPERPTILYAAPEPALRS
jgi:hypothetical protein